MVHLSRISGQCLALALFLISGCSLSAPTSAVLLARNVSFNLRPPAEFVGPRTIEQRIELFHQDRHFVFSAVVQCDSTNLTVVGLGPMGTRVFALRWDGISLWQDRERIPDFPFDLRYLLVDLQTVLFPLESVRRGFAGTALRVSEAAGVRTIQESEGHFARVTYQTGKPWEGKVVFESLLRGYRIEIESIRTRN